MKISVVIPAYKESQLTIQKCLWSITIAKIFCPCEVDTAVITDVTPVGKARNVGARNTDGDVLVFLDADNQMSRMFLKNVYDIAVNASTVGGGVKWVKMDRYSIGRLLFLIPVAIYLYWHQITVGAIWVKREYFNLLRGFLEQNGDEDLDFAIRMKKLARKLHKKFRSLKKCHIVWSTRGFDKYGEWFWVRKYRLFKE